MNNKFRDNDKKEESVEKTGWEIFIDNAKSFFETSIKSSPVETIFEIALLCAGAFRTFDFLTSLGSNATLAVFSLIYSEAGIILYEWMHYKGRRIQSEKRVKNKETGVIELQKYYKTVNQKSIATFGIWLHIVMTAFFTVSDILKSALSEALGSGYDLDVAFAWALGIFVGVSFFTDLVLILNYKRQNPEFIHEEKTQQLIFNRRKHDMDMDEIKQKASLEFAKKNAPAFAELEARMEMEEELIAKYGSTLGIDYIKQNLNKVKNQDDNQNRNNQNRNQQNNNNQNQNRNQNQRNQNDNSSNDRNVKQIPENSGQKDKVKTEGTLNIPQEENEKLLPSSQVEENVKNESNFTTDQTQEEW